MCRSKPRDHFRESDTIKQVEPVNPFINLQAINNIPACVRVDKILGIFGNKVHIDNHNTVTLVDGEVDKLRKRIVAYYGGCLCD